MPASASKTPRRPSPSRVGAPEASQLVAPLVRWFKQARRDLPWRAVLPATGERDPYASLVSELMLQQTQVSRVLEKFGPFMSRFPTARALARASEDDVLSAWTGLGYYRRARLLHAAAKSIALHHAGHVPSDLESLLALPGLGRYTAGAIASIAFNQPAPLVDTNVARVLLRIDGKPLATADKAAQAWVWSRAEQLVGIAHESKSAGLFNEAMMELGALVCTSGSPTCHVCPLRDRCVARAQGTQGQIPLPNARTRRKPVAHTVLVLRLADDRTLVERRASQGLWAGLWQAPTIESPRPIGLAGLRMAFKLPIGIKPTRDADFAFQTTHRDITFRVYRCTIASENDLPISLQIGGRLVNPTQLASLGMSSPMRRVLLTQQR